MIGIGIKRRIRDLWTGQIGWFTSEGYVDPPFEPMDLIEWSSVHPSGETHFHLDEWPDRFIFLDDEPGLWKYL